MFTSSSRTQPCKVCGRNSDADCRWNNDVILCHRGSSFAPPNNLKLGDKLNIEGKDWALVSYEGGFTGLAYVFKPHKPLEKFQGNQWQDKKIEIFNKGISTAQAKIKAKVFLDLAQKAVDVQLFETAPYDQLKKDFALIYEARKQGLEVHRDIRPLAKNDFVMQEILWLIEAANHDLKYLEIAVNDFRTKMLGEVLAP